MIAGVLVVLEVDGHRLGVDDVGHVVGDRLAESLVDHGSRASAAMTPRPARRAGQDDEDRHVPERPRPESAAATPSVTPSTMSFISQTVASGSRPWTTVRTTLATVQPGRDRPDQLQGSPQPREVSDPRSVGFYGQTGLLELAMPSLETPCSLSSTIDKTR